MARLLAIALVLVCSAPVFGANPYARRAEAKAEVQNLLSGGNPQSALARFAYLGEERYAARELLQVLPGVLDPERKRAVATVLAGLEAPAAERQLLAFTRSDDSVLRMQGAIGLGRLKSRRVGALVPLLGDKTLGVRREAARSLGIARHRKAGKALLRAAKAEGEPEVRAVMLLAIGQVGDKRYGPGLVAFLDSSSESTRYAAAQGLCLLGHPKGFAVAEALLPSEDKYARRRGVTLFEGIPAKKSRRYLEPRLEDADKRVAAQAARTLYEGGDKSKLEWLVLASHIATGEEKLAFERELERLMLTDQQRKVILKKAGILP